MHNFEVHSNESPCRKSEHLGLDQFTYAPVAYDVLDDMIFLVNTDAIITLDGVNIEEL